MEQSLSSMQRAFRKFLAGRPARTADNTPLGIVSLAVEQRARLRGILESDPETQSARITRTAIVARLSVAGSPTPFDDAFLEVEEGSESNAVRYFERHLEFGNKFTAAGLAFVIQPRPDELPVVLEYKIERTPEGDKALRRAAEELIPNETVS